MNLMSSIEFGKTLKDVSDSEYRIFRDNFDNLLLQPLQLCFFVPCDLEGNFLEEPEHYELWRKYGSYTQYGEHLTSVCEPYFQAKERVLFEVSEEYLELNIYDENGFFYAYSTIEDLSNDQKLKLTPTALKQIGITDKK